MNALLDYVRSHQPLLDTLHAASSIINVFGWLVSLLVLLVAWQRGRITKFQAFGVHFSLAQEAVVAASRATRTREARAEAIRHPGQRATSAIVDIEALRHIVDRAFVPKVADQLLGKAILWADDNPRNNIYEVEALTKMGLVVDQVVSTVAALEALKRQPYDLVISDMGRGVETLAGYDLLKAIRDDGNPVPFFLFAAGGNLPEHVAAAKQRGAQLSTETTGELLSGVVAFLGEQGV